MNNIPDQVTKDTIEDMSRKMESLTSDVKTIKTRIHDVVSYANN